MSEMLKLYVRGGFEFVDEDTGFTTSDFGVSDNAINKRVTDRSLPAYEQEVEFAKESLENGVYYSAVKLAHAATEVSHVEKVEYVGDLHIGYYEMYITATSPYGQSTKSKTQVSFGLGIIVKVRDRKTVNATDIAHELAKIFGTDLSRRLCADISGITVEERYI